MDMRLLCHEAAHSKSFAMPAVPLQYMDSSGPAAAPFQGPPVGDAMDLPSMPHQASLHSFPGAPHVDPAFCYPDAGLAGIDYQLGMLSQGCMPDSYRSTGCSQSIDSDGTAAPHISRPGSSEVGQGLKAAADSW